MKYRFATYVTLTFVLAVVGYHAVHAWTPVPVADDPLVRMPGTQPDQGVVLDGPGQCQNCHAGYNAEVEPGFNWRGSMMAQSARDFLFFACLTVAGQDSIWAVGTPNAVDICERCHFPGGWLAGRSDPPNASAMTGIDYDGVHCNVCHYLYDPFFETTYAGTREGDDWLGYWDETNASDTPSDSAALETYTMDAELAQALTRFDGQPYYGADNLPPLTYKENGSGQYFVSTLDNNRRASFADANASHNVYYSRYHKSKYFCSTCHDVSNPVLANLGQDGSEPLTTETDPAYSYFHVERTFSEFMLSAYGQQGGAPTNAEFQLQGAPTITEASKCQDCHLRDVVGRACSQSKGLVRPDDSVEHPNSGQPLHDMTGGNAWVSWVLASSVPGSPNYDATNDSLLNQGPATLTLDLTQGDVGIDPVALLAGVERAKEQLLLAATIKNTTYEASTGALSFQVQNNTGHKLISGFPEGRRMFVNIQAYDVGGSLIYEVNPYSDTVGTLKGLPNSPSSPPLGANEVYSDELVYEMHPSSTLTGEDKTFHFALATGRYKDNRIPPKGFDIANAAERLSAPVWHAAEAPDYYSAEEYAGGYDAVSMVISPDADHVEINLYYQTTSREYIEFLRDEIKGTGDLTLTGTGAGGDPPYIIQSDPFFSQLKAWGDTIWDLWTHNMDVPGAAPFLMRQATAEIVGTPEADFVGSPVSGTAPLTVTFTNLSTGDFDTCGWTFGDGGSSSACQDPSHKYTDAGTYTVALTVSGPGGTDALTRTNYITAYASVQADFSASPVSGTVPLTVTFTDLSTGEVSSREWAFGDGVTSTQESPAHTYAMPGVYSPTLTVSGPGGTDALTRTNYITAYHPADVNHDCQIGLADVQMVAAAWRCEGGEICYDPDYDFDGDGIITVVDIMQVAAAWGWSCGVESDQRAGRARLGSQGSGSPADRGLAKGGGRRPFGSPEQHPGLLGAWANTSLPGLRTHHRKSRSPSGRLCVG